MSSAGASTAAYQAGAAQAAPGSPLDALFQQFGQLEAQTLLQEFLSALYAGVNPRQIAQELSDTIDNLSYGRAETIMRTESLGAWNDAALENYRANSDIIGSWVWVCMPGAGTCFPAGTLIGTARGLVPIEDVCVGERVLTHTGQYRRVLARSRREHVGPMTTLEAGASSVTATSDHPFLLERQGQLDWVEAGDIPLGARVFRKIERSPEIGEQCISDGPIERGVGQTHNAIAPTLKLERLARILGFRLRSAMPVGAVNLERDVQRRQVEVYRIAPTRERMLLQERNSQLLEAEARPAFRLRFANVMAIAAKRAEAACRHARRLYAELLAARQAGLDDGRTAACFRAMLTRGATGATVRGGKDGATAWAWEIDCLRPLAFARAVDAVRFARPGGESLATSPAYTLNVPGSNAADSRAESLIAQAIVDAKRLAAPFAVLLETGMRYLPTSGMRMGALMGSVADSRAEAAAALLDPGSGNGEGCAALDTNTFHAHIVTFSRTHVQPETVYNLEVEEDHSYVANGFVVHNCVSCLEEDGTIYSLDEELEDHPNGRCVKGPVTNDYGDILSQYGIDASGEDFGPGPWDDRVSGEEWLLAQDAEIQRQAFGSNAAFNAWRSGDAQLADFVAIRHDAQWGDSIYQQSLKGMGLDARDYGAGTAKAAYAAEVPALPEIKLPVVSSTALEPAAELAAEREKLESLLAPDRASVAVQEATKQKVAEDLGRLLQDNPDWAVLREKLLANTLDRMSEGGAADYVLADVRATYSDAEAARWLLADWAGNDPSAVVALQEATRVEFGLNDARLVADAEALAEAQANWGDVQEGLRAFVRAQYDNTQAFFRDNGISDIAVYRGFAWAEKPELGARSFDELTRGYSQMDIGLQPLSSFTSSDLVAGIFGMGSSLGGEDAEYGLVIGARVSVDQVLSTAQTGFGALGELETVILGGDKTVWAYAEEKPILDLGVGNDLKTYMTLHAPTDATLDERWRIGLEYLSSIEPSMVERTEGLLAKDWAEVDRILPDGKVVKPPLGELPREPLPKPEFPEDYMSKFATEQPVYGPYTGTQKELIQQYADVRARAYQARQDMFNATARYGSGSPEANVFFKQMARLEDEAGARATALMEGVPPNKLGALFKKLDTATNAARADLERAAAETAAREATTTAAREVESPAIQQLRADREALQAQRDALQAKQDLLSEKWRSLVLKQAALDPEEEAAKIAKMEQQIARVEKQQGTNITKMEKLDAKIAKVDEKLPPVQVPSESVAAEAFKAASAATEQAQEVVTAAEARDLTQHQVEELIANKQTFTDPNTKRADFWTGEVDGQKFFIRPANGPETVGVAETTLADRVGLGDHYVSVQTGVVDGTWYEIQPLLQGHQFANLEDTNLRDALSITNTYLSKDERMKIDLFSSLISDGDRYANNMWLTEDGKLLQIDYDAFSPNIYPPSGDLLRYTPSGEEIADWYRLNDAPKPSAEVREWMRSTLLSPENKQAMLDAAEHLSMPSYLSEARIAEEHALAVNYQRARIAAFEQYASLRGTPNLGKLREIMDSERIQAIAAGEEVAQAAEMATSAGSAGERALTYGAYTLPEINQQAEQALIQRAQEVLSSVDGVASHADALDLGTQIHDYLDQRIGPLADWGNEAYGIRLRAPELTDAERTWAMGDASAHGGVSWLDAEAQYNQALHDETLRLLQQVREVGGTDLQVLTDAKTDQKVVDAIQQAQDSFPKDWLQASNDNGGLWLERVRSSTDAGYYQADYRSGNGQIAVRYTKGDPANGIVDTAIHELSHRMEDAVDGLWLAEKEFYDLRTAGEDFVDLTTNVAGKTKVDRWAWEYIGKQPIPRFHGYGLTDATDAKLRDFRHYELLSVGLEWVLGGAGDGAYWLSQDEEFHQFILGLLFGGKGRVP